MANGNDLEDMVFKSIFYLKQIYPVRKEEEREGKMTRKRTCLLFHPKSVTSELSEIIFLTHAYIHKSCPKF